MTKIIGHRGVAGLALENSPDSIKAALLLPIEAIEFDVRRTKDGQLIILHDMHTGRVANRELYVNNATLAELRRLKLKNGQRIMTLDETLRIIGNKKSVVLDIKDGGSSMELARILAGHPNLKPTISSRIYGELESIHKALPDLPFLAQSHHSPNEVVHIAHQLGADGVSLNKWLINPYTYHLARRAGLEVRVYTVNHLWLMRLITKLYPGVIYTDHPERFMTKEKKPRERHA